MPLSQIPGFQSILGTLTNPQTTTLVLATLQGLQVTIEKHSPMVRKRSAKPKTIYPGDGKNLPWHVQDPGIEFEPVTLELHPDKSKVFLAAAESLFQQQMTDPTKATTVTLYSLNDAGKPLDQRIGYLAVIQEIHSPDGDTNNHALATAKIIVDVIGIGGGTSTPGGTVLRGFGGVGNSAILRSLDQGGLSFTFKLAPHEHDREVSATWENADVAQAAPDFIEYRKTDPEKRTYRYQIDGYDMTGGINNDGTVEGWWKTLKSFTQIAPGKHRAHVCMLTIGVQSFQCVVENVTWPVKKVGASAGALQVMEGTIVLKESRESP